MRSLRGPGRGAVGQFGSHHRHRKRRFGSRHAGCLLVMGRGQDGNLMRCKSSMFCRDIVACSPGRQDGWPHGRRKEGRVPDGQRGGHARDNREVSIDAAEAGGRPTGRLRGRLDGGCALECGAADSRNVNSMQHAKQHLRTRPAALRVCHLQLYRRPLEVSGRVSPTTRSPPLDGLCDRNSARTSPAAGNVVVQHRAEMQNATFPPWPTDESSLLCRRASP
jgi:hypothetical protein